MLVMRRVVKVRPAICFFGRGWNFDILLGKKTGCAVLRRCFHEGRCLKSSFQTLIELKVVFVQWFHSISFSLQNQSSCAAIFKCEDWEDKLLPLSRPCGHKSIYLSMFLPQQAFQAGPVRIPRNSKSDLLYIRHRGILDRGHLCFVNYLFLRALRSRRH